MSELKENKTSSIRKKVTNNVFALSAIFLAALIAAVTVVVSVASNNIKKINTENGYKTVGGSKEAIITLSHEYLKTIAGEQAEIYALIQDSEHGENLNELLKTYRVNETGRFFVIDKNGNYISCPDTEWEWFGDYAVKFYNLYNEREKKNETGFVTLGTVGNFQSFGLEFSLIPDSEWILGVVVPETEIAASWENFTATFNENQKNTVKDFNDTFNVALWVIVILAAGLMFAAISVMTARLHLIVTRPLENFVFDAKKALEEMEYKMEIPSNDEIDILKNTFFKITNDLRANMKDVHNLAYLTEKFESKANMDALTGIYNRRYFNELVGKYTVVAAKQNAPTFVGMLDLDHFKKVNDTYGHAAGDEVLKVIAERVKETIRPTDLFGRYGGEEFILFIIVSDMGNAQSLGERIRTNIEAEPVVFEGKSIPITLSMGIAPAAPDFNFEVAVKNADAALYKAKENGRNRVEIFEA